MYAVQSSLTIDVTQGRLSSHIWRLAWPITASVALLYLPGIYDTVWLGRLGSGAQAAAGVTMSVRITMISVLMALSMGGGAVVARYVGAKDQAGANLATLQAIMLMIVASGGLGVVGVIFARPLMSLGGADAATLPLAVRYARVIFGGLIPMELVPSIGFMLSAAGAPQVMLSMALIGMGVLLVSEPLLVHWLNVEGAALALVGSNLAGTLWGFYVLLSGRAPLRLDLRNLRLDLPIMGRIVRVSAPGVVLRGAPNLAMSLLTRFVAWYGAAALAAWIIVQRIYYVALIPGMGLSRVAPPMVGQNLGAAQPERAKRSVGIITRVTALVGVGVIVLLVLFAPPLMALFSNDAETIEIGVHVLRVLSFGQLAFLMNQVFDAAQTGAGDTTSPMVINLIALWLIQVPLSVLLARVAGLDADGIWLALTSGWIVQMMLMGWWFNRGRWQHKQLL